MTKETHTCLNYLMKPLKEMPKFYLQKQTVNVRSTFDCTEYNTGYHCAKISAFNKPAY